MLVHHCGRARSITVLTEAERFRRLGDGIVNKSLDGPDQGDLKMTIVGLQIDWKGHRQWGSLRDESSILRFGARSRASPEGFRENFGEK